jgi:hypothetical protein
LAYGIYDADKRSMIIAVLTFVGVIAASLGIGFLATSRATFGYEDAEGFHFGQEQNTAHEEYPYSVASPKPI